MAIAAARHNNGTQLTGVHVAIFFTLLTVLWVAASSPRSEMRANPLAGAPIPVAGAQAERVGALGGGGPSAQHKTLPLKARPVGMPSPAAAASLARERTGVNDPGKGKAIRMKGMPSPAAAATFAPQVLPLHREDHGPHLPKMIGERDDHSLTDHYSSTESEPTPVQDAPLTTPGASAAAAEQEASVQAVVSTSQTGPYQAF